MKKLDDWSRLSIFLYASIAYSVIALIVMVMVGTFHLLWALWLFNVIMLCMAYVGAAQILKRKEGKHGRRVIKPPKYRTRDNYDPKIGPIEPKEDDE